MYSDDNAADSIPLTRGMSKSHDGHVTLTQCDVDNIVDRVKVIKGRLAKGEQVGA